MSKEAKKPSADEAKKWTFVELVDQFYSEVEGLAEEMEEWRSNIEEKFSSTDKYSRVEESAQTLQSIADERVDTEPFEEFDEAIAVHAEVAEGEGEPGRAFGGCVRLRARGLSRASSRGLSRKRRSK